MGDLRGFLLCKNGPQILHLFFADDGLIFCRVKMSDVQTIQSTLALYERAFGQKINGIKTNLFFGKSVLESTKTDLKNFLGVSEIKEYEKYLGFPAMVGRKKKKGKLYLYKGEYLGETSRVEGESFVTSRKGGVIESYCASNSNLCHELFPTTRESFP